MFRPMMMMAASMMGAAAFMKPIDASKITGPFPKPVYPRGGLQPRKWKNRGNLYQPNGYRECARRRRQMGLE